MEQARKRGSGKNGGQGSILDFVQQNQTQNEAADLGVGMFFYENGISFNVARSASWLEMWEKVKAAGPGWKPPGYEKLRTSILEKASVFCRLYS